ncbi:actin-like [Coffea eugenioides]|uniref:actin-like n=1 Tax=Coffea eugenioides TaxID=49369 RepID=UPI000F60A052|nr:actin-like [Coffea eugenioides]
MKLVQNKAAYVALNIQQELELAKKIPSPVNEEYELPCGHFMNFRSQRFRNPEALFQPSSARFVKDGENVGVHKMIFNSIMKCDIGIRNYLFKNIMLTGGSTLFPGFVEGITKEINHKFANKMLKNVAPPNRMYNACVGGSVLALLNTFEQTRYKEVLVKAHTAASGAVLRLQIAPVLGRKRKPIEWSEFQILFSLLPY